MRRFIARPSAVSLEAFEVADLRAEMARLAAAGFRLLSDEPQAGADDKLVCFVHPQTAGGVLVELCQSRS